MPARLKAIRQPVKIDPDQPSIFVESPDGKPRFTANDGDHTGRYCGTNEVPPRLWRINFTVRPIISGVEVLNTLHTRSQSGPYLLNTGADGSHCVEPMAHEGIRQQGAVSQSIGSTTRAQSCQGKNDRKEPLHRNPGPCAPAGRPRPWEFFSIEGVIIGLWNIAPSAAIRPPYSVSALRILVTRKRTVKGS